MTINYARHGFDAAAELDETTIAKAQAVATLAALVELECDAHTYTDEDDKAVMAERVEQLRGTFETQRVAAKMTKREAAEQHRAILQESHQRLARVHLNIAVNEKRGLIPDGQDRHKQRVEALYRAVQHHLDALDDRA